MPLDLAVLSATDSVDRSVAIGPDVHFEMLSLSSRLGLLTISRMSDYYEDVYYSDDEVRRLVDEVATAMSQTSNDALLAVFTNIAELLQYAIVHGMRVCALAD